MLLHHSARKQAWDPLRLLAMVRSIARGMHHLHSRRILHRDLKPANIFVSHGQQMKIGDLGMARFVTPPGVAAGPPVLERLTPNTFGTIQVGCVRCAVLHCGAAHGSCVCCTSSGGARWRAG